MDPCLKNNSKENFTFLDRLKAFLPLSPFLLPLILLLPSFTRFPYPGGDSVYSDISLTHYPNAFFLRHSLWVEHTVPLWSPLILSGAPFAANPLSGLWYPPGWLALLLPLPFAFNLLVALHLVWGGLGGYYLLRAERLSHPAALLGGLAFAVLPKMFAHFGAGHLTLIYAVSWTPWLFLASRNDRQPKISRFRYWEAVVFALLILADIRWAAFAGLGWCFYCLEQGGDPESVEMGWWKMTFHRILDLGKQTCLAVLLAFSLLLPLYEYARLSTRANMTAKDVFAFSLPASRLLGLVYPDFAGFHEYMLYPGVIIIILCLLAILWGSTHSKGGIWMWIAALSLVFSLGSNLPYLTSLAGLPGLSWLRVPSRALFLAGFSMAMLSAYAVEDLERVQKDKDRRNTNLLLIAFLGFVLSFALGSWFLTHQLSVNFAWAAGVALPGTIWILMRTYGRTSMNVFWYGLLGLLVLDLVVVDISLFTTRSLDSVFAEGQLLAEELVTHSGYYRLYSPSYSLPQQTAANYALQLADGVDPLQLASYVSFMEKASGVPNQGYSVTLPSFASGDPWADNAVFIPDPGLLGLMNVRFVAAEYELDVESLELKWQDGETRLYENSYWLPRAWLQPKELPLGRGIQEARIINWSANRIEIETSGSGLLVLSEVDYPGWQAWVDGERSQIQVMGGVLRAVDLGLDPDHHQVVFLFRPFTVYFGMLASSLAVVFLVWQFLLYKKRKGEPRQ